MVRGLQSIPDILVIIFRKSSSNFPMNYRRTLTNFLDYKIQIHRINLIYLFYNQVPMFSISKTTENKLDEDIVQLLSEVFKLFKSQHSNMEKFIYENLNFQNTYQGNQIMKNQLNIILREQKLIMEKLKTNKNNLINFRLTFYRLFNRFIQIIHKYNKNNCRRHSKMVNSYYTSLEKIICSAVSNQTFLYYEALVQICEVSEKFTTNIMSQYLLEEMDSQKTIPNVEEKIQFDKQSQKSSDRKSSVSNESTIQSNKLILLKNVQFEKQEKQKLFNYYNCINCLDISFNQFKKLMETSQTSQNQLYNQMYARNMKNSELILKYNKEYMNNKLKRREVFQHTQGKHRHQLTPIFQRKQSRKQNTEILNISLMNPEIISPQSLEKVSSSQKSERKSIRSDRSQKKQVSKQKSLQPRRLQQTNIFSSRKTNQNIDVLNKLLLKLDEDMKMNQIAKRNLFMKFDNKINFELKKVQIKMDKPTFKPPEIQPFIPVKKPSTIAFQTVKKTWDKRYIMVHGQKFIQFQKKRPKKYSYEFNIESEMI